MPQANKELKPIAKLPALAGNARGNTGVLVVGNFLYVSSEFGVIKVFKLIDKGRATLLTTIDQPSVDLSSFSRGSQTVLVALGAGKLQLYDITAPETKKITPLGSAPAAVARGGTSIVVSHDTNWVYSNGVTDVLAFDVSNLQNVIAYNSVFTLPGVDLSLQGSLFVDSRADKSILYLSVPALAQVLVFDIGAPHRASPLRIATLKTPEIGLDFDQLGKWLVIGGAVGLTVVDVTNPAKPKITEQLDTNLQDKTELTVGFSASGKSLFVTSLGRTNLLNEYAVSQDGKHFSLKLRRTSALSEGYVPWSFDFFNNVIFITNSGHTDLDVRLFA